MSNTQDSLYPKQKTRKCKCGVIFVERPNKVKGDRADRCSSCNRSPWSKLFASQSSDNNETHTVLPMKKVRNKQNG